MSKTGARHDPVAAFRFTVTFDDLPPGGFSDCTGLQSETEVQEYAEGGLNTHTWRLPGRTKQSNVTLKRGIVNKVLWDWYDAIAHRRLQVAQRHRSSSTTRRAATTSSSSSSSTRFP